MALEKEMTLNDYINIIKRRMPYVIIVFFLVFISAIITALILHPVYQSIGTILIESEQVKTDIAKESYAEERFAALKQVVLTNENLIKIAEKYKLYGLDKKPNLPRIALVKAALDNIKVVQLQAEGGRRSYTTFAFQISFTHSKAEETYQITNDLVKLFLEIFSIMKR
jgi:uncharacterized protein involved in exopolysaccharide biosynthesis